MQGPIASVLISLAVLSLLACPDDAIAASVYNTTMAGRVGVDNINIRPSSQSRIIGTAEAYIDPFARRSVRDQSGKQLGDNGDTGLVTAFDFFTPPGGGFVSIDARARTIWQVRQNRRGGLTVFTTGTFAQVNYNGAGTMPRGKRGNATVSVRDPFIFENAFGQTYEMSYGFDDDFFLQAFQDPLIVFDEPLQAGFVTEAGSNMPGLESLFVLTMGINGEHPESLQLNFESNPLLGLNDEAITADILAHMLFNPADSSYRLTSEFDYISGLAITSTVDRLELSWNEFGGSIPEPSSAALVALGALGLLFNCGRSRDRIRRKSTAVTLRRGADR